MIASYADLYTYVIMDLPGAPLPVALQYLQQAGREFARASRAFRGPLDPLPVTNYKQDYDLTQAHNYSASVEQIIAARINGTPVALQHLELFQRRYLRLLDPAVPSDENVERLLICAASPKTAYTAWTGTTAGYFKLTINSSTYHVGPCDFSACTSMDDVARVLQDAWRTAQAYNRNYVKWAEKGNNKFLFWTDDGEITYLTAGTSGTDISGTLFLNGLTGGGASVAPVLEVEAALLPDMRTDILPDWFLDPYGMVIAAKAVHEMTKLRGSAAAPNPWYNAELAVERWRDYQNGLSQAKRNIRCKQGRDIAEGIL